MIFVEVLRQPQHATHEKRTHFHGGLADSPTELRRLFHDQQA